MCWPASLSMKGPWGGSRPTSSMAYRGTAPGGYYHKDPGISGLVSTEDMVVVVEEMGIDTAVDVDAAITVEAGFMACSLRNE